MVLRGRHQFPLILTSDGSLDVYPENKTSRFQIFLSEPLELDGDDWEVGLMGINYPYSWTNLGPSANVFMKLFAGAEGGVKEVHFPDWQCTSMEEVVGFLTRRMKESDVPGLWFGLDELGRLKLESTFIDVDVGFSDNMLRLLGIAAHTAARFMQIEAFDRRQKYRDILCSICRDDWPFPFGDSIMRERVMKTVNVNEFVEVVMQNFDDDGRKLEILYRKFPEIDLIDIHGVQPIQGISHNFGSTEGPGTLEKVMMFLMIVMKKLFKEGQLSFPLKGSTPGMLNPVERMFIYLDIMEPIDFNDGFVKLLKMVNTRGAAFKTTQEDFPQPLYFPVRREKISNIEVLIVDGNGDPVSFRSGTVVLTLHFRKAEKFGGARY